MMYQIEENNTIITLTNVEEGLPPLQLEQLPGPNFRWVVKRLCSAVKKSTTTNIKTLLSYDEVNATFGITLQCDQFNGRYSTSAVLSVESLFQTPDRLFDGYVNIYIYELSRDLGAEIFWKDKDA